VILAEDSPRSSVFRDGNAETILPKINNSFATHILIATKIVDKHEDRRTMFENYINNTKYLTFVFLHLYNIETISGTIKMYALLIQMLG